MPWVSLFFSFSILLVLQWPRYLTVPLDWSRFTHIFASHRSASWIKPFFFGNPVLMFCRLNLSDLAGCVMPVPFILIWISQAHTTCPPYLFFQDPIISGSNFLSAPPACPFLTELLSSLLCEVVSDHLLALCGLQPLTVCLSVLWHCQVYALITTSLLCSDCWLICAFGSWGPLGQELYC